MSAGTAPLARFALVVVLVCSAAADEQVTAGLGQTVTLPCGVNNSNNIIAVEWSRPDLEEDDVLLYREKKVNTEQHPSFKDRVELKEGCKEDGDVSLILKNVMTNDTGTYECRVKEDGASSAQLISRVRLTVNITVEPGQTVTLPCRVRDSSNTVQWTKADLETQRQRQTLYTVSVETCQRSPENDRMELKEGCKHGDVSLTVKNVSTADSGTYECGVKEGGRNRRKRAADEPISIINLSVSSAAHSGGDEGAGGSSGGHVGLVVGLVVGVLLVALIAAVGFMIYRRRQEKSSSPPPVQPQLPVDPLLESGP
ncbi:coxsackievirus and adenovirus receptor-like [Parambassis ranga]|uniref:Coxsackievirus and adenovirus receptor-like n=1 Tax=Parambassis ranga TaxID=210632 RepID=A0A6P7IPW6_9TELE|nr:coxsackievirus and adenovirus receptor-like [Parambassis ranga]